MTDRELMQQALDALQELNKLSVGENAICLPAEIDDAMDNLRARLAQPEPEPLDYKELARRTMALYPTMPVKAIEEPICAPPQREWQGLTGKEVNHLLAANADCAEKLIRAIEAKLKEKNT